MPGISGLRVRTWIPEVRGSGGGPKYRGVVTWPVKTIHSPNRPDGSMASYADSGRDRICLENEPLNSLGWLSREGYRVTHLAELALGALQRGRLEVWGTL